MLTNNEIRRIRSLAQKKQRQQDNQYLIEGARLVKTAVAAGIGFDALYLTEQFQNNPEHQTLITDLKEARYIWEPVNEKQARKMSETITPSGILALCSLPAEQSIIAEELPEGPWLYLDNLSDPGNLGTLLRTAAWFGVINVGLSPDCVDPWNPKVLRGGMGAHFHLNLSPDTELSALKTGGRTLYGAHMDGDPVNEIEPDQTGKWVLVVGGEARGLSDKTRTIIDQFISISKPGTGESLNAAVAGGILLEKLTAPA